MLAEEPDLPSKMGLQLGDRLEVKWQLEEEGAPASTKWWGAVLDSRPHGETDGEGRQVYVLRYDPDPDSGFEEQECCRVTFLEEHALYDFGQDDELAWRQAGDSWEAPAVPEGEEAEGGEGAIYSLNEIAAAIKAAERRRGRTLDQDAAEALSAFPQDKQMFIAAGFRNFSDHISAGVAQLQAQHGPDYVVTAADVKAVTAAAMAAAMQNRGLGGARM